MIKNFMLNVEGLHTENDLNKIQRHFDGDNGIIGITAIIEANIVNIKYDDQYISHTKRFIDDLNNLGYTVK